MADAGNNSVLGYRAPFVDGVVADVVLGQPDGASGNCRLSAAGLCGPGGVAVDRDGNVYVADILQNRILGYDDPLRRDAVADRVLGSRGMRRNQCTDRAACFSEPNGTHPGINVYGGVLAMDPAGRLLVANGGYVFVFARPRKAVAKSRQLIELPGTYFASPAIAADSSGRIYAIEGGRVERFRADGTGPDLEIGEPCHFDDHTGLPDDFGAASLCAPFGLATSPAGELFVSDAFAHRVVVYDLPEPPSSLPTVSTPTRRPPARIGTEMCMRSRPVLSSWSTLETNTAPVPPFQARVHLASSPCQ